MAFRIERERDQILANLTLVGEKDTELQNAEEKLEKVKTIFNSFDGDRKFLKQYVEVHLKWFYDLKASHGQSSHRTYLHEIEDGVTTTYRLIKRIYDLLVKGVECEKEKLDNRVQPLKEGFLARFEQFVRDVLDEIEKEGQLYPQDAIETLSHIDNETTSESGPDELSKCFQRVMKIRRIKSKIQRAENEATTAIEEALCNQRYDVVLNLLKHENPMRPLHLESAKKFFQKHLAILGSLPDVESIFTNPSFPYMVGMMKYKICPNLGLDLLERIRIYLRGLNSLFSNAFHDPENHVVSIQQMDLWVQFMNAFPDEFVGERNECELLVRPYAQKLHDDFKRAIQDENFQLLSVLYPEICGMTVLYLTEKQVFNQTYDSINADIARSELINLEAKYSAKLKQEVDQKNYEAAKNLTSQVDLIKKTIDSVPNHGRRQARGNPSRLSVSSNTNPLGDLAIDLEKKIKEVEVIWRSKQTAQRRTQMKRLRMILNELEPAKTMFETLGLEDQYNQFEIEIRHTIDEEQNQVLSQKVLDVQFTVMKLLEIRQIGDDLPFIETHVKSAIGKCLQFIMNLDPELLTQTGDHLRKMNDPLSNLILAENLVFRAILVDMWNRNLVSMPPSTALTKFRKVVFQSPQTIKEKVLKVPALLSSGGWKEWTKNVVIDGGEFPGEPFSDVEVATLTAMYETFEKNYRNYWMKHRDDPQMLICEAERIVNSVRRPLDHPKENLPQLLACLFAYWTLTQSDIKMSDKSETFLRKPHCVQVISIMRFFTPQITNNICQIGTGQGKSILLGMVSVIFALCGYECHCVCYSRSLSERDYDDFKPFFTDFKVAKRIRYGTIESICDHLLNEQVPIRDLVSKFLVGEKVDLLPKTSRKRVLLIDEADVLFGEQFFGHLYQPAAMLRTDDSFELLKYIYDHHHEKDFSLREIFELPAYKSLVQKFSNFESIIQTQVFSMLADVKSIDHTPTPPQLTTVGLETKIGYESNGEIVPNLSYGHKTNFAYFRFWKNGKLSEESVRKNVGIPITAGQYSYSELPCCYDVICGVTGTLQTMTCNQLDLLGFYRIHQLSFAPSVHGDRSVVFRPNDHFNILFELGAYYQAIISKIQENQTRAVLVFFEANDDLQAFLKSEEWEQTGLKCEILNESTLHKENVINRSTTSGQITLVTKVFGRGTDFRCYDDKVRQAGGVLVIQTFLSDCDSEEIQMKGRTGRQRDPGQYVLLLHCADLMKMFNMPEEHFLEMNTNNEPAKVYATLKAERNALYEQKVQKMAKNIEVARGHHQNTETFIETLKKQIESHQPIDDPALMKAFINLSLAVNPVANVISKSFHVYFCLDESGSMYGEPWDHLTEAVVKFVQDRVAHCQQFGRTCEDLFTVICYDTDADLRARDVSSNENFEEILGDPRMGGTQFKAGLQVVYAEMKRFYALPNANHIPVLLFMSDGGASDGDTEMADIYRDFKDQGLQVYVVGFGQGCAESRLTQLASKANGCYKFGSTGELLKTEFAEISANLENTRPMHI